MKLSVILVNYRGWKRLRTCLESLRCLTHATWDWEVLVIDNQSADGRLQEFINYFPEFSFIENSGNTGFAHGCNVGARRSTGDYIFFLNPDTEVTLEAFDQLLQTAEQHPEFTIVSCKQVSDSGKDTEPYGLFPGPFTLTSLLRTIYRLTHSSAPVRLLTSAHRAILPDWVSGSAILMSKEKFNALGGWNEDYWMYYEDADLCKRVKQAGGTVALIETIRIIHNHGGASRVNIEVKALTKAEVSISKHVYIHNHFHGLRKTVMQTYLVVNNLLLSQFILAILGIVFFFVPSLRVYTKLYINCISYYAGAWAHRTWISPRSVNYKK